MSIKLKFLLFCWVSVHIHIQFGHWFNFNLTCDFNNYIIAVTLGIVMLAIIVLCLLLLTVVVSENEIRNGTRNEQEVNYFRLHAT